jgi:hypothetical protein
MAVRKEDAPKQAGPSIDQQMSRFFEVRSEFE